jgi:hypothetical protein
VHEIGIVELAAKVEAARLELVRFLASGAPKAAITASPANFSIVPPAARISSAMAS